MPFLNCIHVFSALFQVHKHTGHVEFGDRTFHSLPSLVRELRESWMTDLQPFYSTVGMVGMEATLQAADD